MWDSIKREFVDTPDKVKDFINDIQEVCMKYGLSISHEDGHGAFIIEDYCDENISWLKDANLSVVGRSLDNE